MSELASLRTWGCKIGECSDDELPPGGADGPMREAVETAYRELTGRDSTFIFSGWGYELDEPERAVVEDCLPSDKYEAAWKSGYTAGLEAGSKALKIIGGAVPQ